MIDWEKKWDYNWELISFEKLIACVEKQNWMFLNDGNVIYNVTWNQVKNISSCRFQQYQILI